MRVFCAEKKQQKRRENEKILSKKSKCTKAAKKFSHNPTD
jgi:hypothetical protein